jgi:hypothetical protein
MLVRRVASALLGFVALAPGASRAQAAPDGAPAASSAPAGSPAPASPSEPAADGASGSASATASAGLPPVTARGSHGAIITQAVPGFETMGDGSTRLFVELSKPVAYDTKVTASAITYVLKGAHAGRRNNTNPLVTVHFNTPVTSARLVPHGHDLWFVLQLRAKVQPAVAMDAAKDGSAVMRIDMPKGDYLPAQASSGDAADGAPGAAASSGAATATAASAQPTPSAPHGSHHRGQPPSSSP